MTVLAVKQTINLANFTAGQPIRASDWSDLFSTTNYVFTRSGVRVQGIHWDDSGTNDPYQTTTATTYLQTNQNAGRDLNSFWPQIKLPRRMDNSGDSVALTMAIVGMNINVRMTARFTDTDADYGTTSIATVTDVTPQNASSNLFMTWANAHEGASTANPLRVISLRFEAGSEDGVAVGELYALTVYSKILTASEIPTDEP